ncbi:MAG: hypothetical protein ACTIJQ_16475 [Alcaligenes sp.]
MSRGRGRPAGGAGLTLEDILKAGLALLDEDGGEQGLSMRALALFAVPEALAGVTRDITDRLRVLLVSLTPEAELWLTILLDHAHGCGLPASAMADGQSLEGLYQQALDKLLVCLSAQ